ncbi:MAG: zinc transporter ZupT [Erysipelotrichaceae bacterium]
MGNFWLALLMTTIAGLSTGLGGLIAFFAKKTKTSFLSICLGFSAGVMIYVSMVELLSESNLLLSNSNGEKLGTLYSMLGFFGGVIFIAIIDKMIPEKQNPHHVMSPKHADREFKKALKLKRVGVLTAVSIAIHNFPEGIATFVSAMQSIEIAIPIVIAIAIHNLPEGIAVSVPIYYATGNRLKAFKLSLLSGLAEPIGGIIGYLLLAPYLNDTLNGLLYAAIAGIMVYISFDELLPSAREYGNDHLAIYGLFFGMLVMGLSMWLII